MYDTLNDMKKKALILKGTCESWILSECQMLKIKINKHEENNTEIDIKFVLKYMLCNTSDLITSQKLGGLTIFLICMSSFIEQFYCNYKLGYSLWLFLDIFSSLFLKI